MKDKLEEIAKYTADIFKDIKLYNSFLFTGSFSVLISLLIPSDYTTIGLKIGLITLIFGGVFRLLNIITKTFIEVENNKIPKNQFTLWNFIRFCIWIGALIIYIIWINSIIQIITIP